MKVMISPIDETYGRLNEHTDELNPHPVAPPFFWLDVDQFYDPIDYVYNLQTKQMEYKHKPVDNSSLNTTPSENQPTSSGLQKA
jgi:hypothetical protein